MVERREVGGVESVILKGGRGGRGGRRGRGLVKYLKIYLAGLYQAFKSKKSYPRRILLKAHDICCKEIVGTIVPTVLTWSPWRLGARGGLGLEKMLDNSRDHYLHAPAFDCTELPSHPWVPFPFARQSS